MARHWAAIRKYFDGDMAHFRLPFLDGAAFGIPTAQRWPQGELTQPDSIFE